VEDTDSWSIAGGKLENSEVFEEEVVGLMLSARVDAGLAGEEMGPGIVSIDAGSGDKVIGERVGAAEGPLGKGNKSE
jgi:hypothetical protein